MDLITITITITILLFLFYSIMKRYQYTRIAAGFGWDIEYHSLSYGINRNTITPNLLWRDGCGHLQLFRVRNIAKAIQLSQLAHLYFLPIISREDIWPIQRQLPLYLIPFYQGRRAALIVFLLVVGNQLRDRGGGLERVANVANVALRKTDVARESSLGFVWSAGVLQRAFERRDGPAHLHFHLSLEGELGRFPGG